MNNHPNLTRLAHRDPNTLTARELQVALIYRDTETAPAAELDKAQQTTRLGHDVPALLAHIDELYSEITAIHDLNVAYARRLLDEEKQRQHLIREHAQRQQQTLDPTAASWIRESLSRQEYDARVGERLFGELLRALPKAGV